MSGIFEHLAAFDNGEHETHRVAAAVANRRYTLLFRGFLHEASNLDEFNQRLALISEDIDDMVNEVAAEYGGDPEKLTASLAGLKEAKGGFCDDCRKWKSGPKAGCSCGSGEEVNPGTEIDSASDDDEDPFTGPRSDHEDHKSSAKQADIATQPIMTPMPLPDEPGKGVPDIDGELEDAPSAVGYKTISSATPAMQKARELITAKTAADVDTGDSAERREKLPVGDVTALGDPSPKIDKKLWKPNAIYDKGNVPPLDTEGKGSPHPTIKQDILAKPNYEGNGYLDQTDAVTEHNVDLAKNTGDFTAPNTDTWSGTDGLATPVTQTAISSTHESVAPIGYGSDGLGEDPFLGPEPAHSQMELTPQNYNLTPEEEAQHQQFLEQLLGQRSQDQSQPQQSGFEQYVKGQGLQTDLGPDRRIQQPINPAHRAAIDPDKNPIRDILEKQTEFVPQDSVKSAISRYEQS